MLLAKSLLDLSWVYQNSVYGLRLGQVALWVKVRLALGRCPQPMGTLGTCPGFPDFFFFLRGPRLAVVK